MIDEESPYELVKRARRRFVYEVLSIIPQSLVAQDTSCVTWKNENNKFHLYGLM